MTITYNLSVKDDYASTAYSNFLKTVEFTDPIEERDYLEIYGDNYLVSEVEGDDVILCLIEPTCY